MTPGAWVPACSRSSGVRCASWPSALWSLLAWSFILDAGKLPLVSRLVRFNTAQNGPIWILGTPLFYEYTAHYDRGDGSGKETSMAFVPRSEESCGRCKGTHIEKGEGLLVLEGEESNTLGNSDPCGLAPTGVLDEV